jgi:hypothetical protein
VPAAGPAQEGAERRRHHRDHHERAHRVVRRHLGDQRVHRLDDRHVLVARHHVGEQPDGERRVRVDDVELQLAQVARGAPGRYRHAVEVGRPADRPEVDDVRVAGVARRVAGGDDEDLVPQALEHLPLVPDRDLGAAHAGEVVVREDADAQSRRRHDVLRDASPAGAAGCRG